jgi:hypothetical protein
VPHAEHPRLLREPGERRNREDDEDRCGPALGPREVLIRWTGVVRNLGNLQAKRRRQLGSPTWGCPVARLRPSGARGRGSFRGQGRRPPTTTVSGIGGTA